MPCRDRVCRRGRLEVLGSQRRSIVGERHEASLTTRNPTERFEAQEDRERILVFWTSSLLMPLHLYATVWYDAKVLCKLCCTAVMQKSNAPYSSVSLSCSVHSCIWIPARSCDVPSQSYIFKYCTSRSGMIYGRQNLLARRLLCSKLLYRLLVSKSYGVTRH